MPRALERPYDGPAARNALETADRLEVASGNACFRGNGYTVPCTRCHAMREFRLANRKQEIGFRYGAFTPRQEIRIPDQPGSRVAEKPAKSFQPVTSFVICAAITTSSTLLGAAVELPVQGPGPKSGHCLTPEVEEWWKSGGTVPGAGSTPTASGLTITLKRREP